MITGGVQLVFGVRASTLCTFLKVFVLLRGILILVFGSKASRMLVFIETVSVMFKAFGKKKIALKV